MKTVLPTEIKTVDEAKAFLSALHANGEDYHPEDNTNDLCGDPFTIEEGTQLNKLMSDIYDLEGNDNHRDMIFDPCLYLLMLDPDYRERVKAEAPEEYLIDALKYGFDV